MAWTQAPGMWAAADLPASSPAPDATSLMDRHGAYATTPPAPFHLSASVVPLTRREAWDLWVDTRRPSLRVRPLVAWYDLWIGVYVDKSRTSVGVLTVYLLPIPCVGVRVTLTWRPNRR